MVVHSYLKSSLHCYTDFLEGVHLDWNCKVVLYDHFLEKPVDWMHKEHYCKDVLAVTDHMNLDHLMYTVHYCYSCWVA